MDVLCYSLECVVWVCAVVSLNGVYVCVGGLVYGVCVDVLAMTCIVQTHAMLGWQSVCVMFIQGVPRVTWKSVAWYEFNRCIVMMRLFTVCMRWVQHRVRGLVCMVKISKTISWVLLMLHATTRNPMCEIRHPRCSQQVETLCEHQKPLFFLIVIITFFNLMLCNMFLDRLRCMLVDHCVNSMSFICCTVVSAFKGCYDTLCGCVLGGVSMCVVCVLLFVRCVCDSNKEYG